MLTLPAQITLHEARQVRADLLQRIAAAPGTTLTVDAQALQQVDSATLAVLLACRRQAEARNLAWSVQGAPVHLTQLARLYGVDGLLGLQSPAA
ncbi:STAS domain-containing protein [Ideonella sp. B7]|uniref:STAS domain-containing protein n=1 Tax=Ideonella benzenivorans TaxID=2831643 RepID=UPI001CED6343|nr:STAS domain-containing protein [Ideonella benzenivorans]MCA6218727.1 STAS domain-containing protein [Ideonella benzenivorans]